MKNTYLNSKHIAESDPNRDLNVLDWWFLSVYICLGIIWIVANLPRVSP